MAEAPIVWRTEVRRVIEHGGDTVGVVIRGFPFDLVWADDRPVVSDSLLIESKGKFYRIRGEDFQQAVERLEQPCDPLDGLLSDDELFLKWPSIKDQKFCDAVGLARTDDRYCWVVASFHRTSLSGVAGVGDHDRNEFVLEYWTDTNITTMEPLPIRTCDSRNFIPRMPISDKISRTFPGFTWLLPYFILFSMFSRGRPRQLETEEELYDVALRALMRRAHSVQEMQKKLSRYTRNELLVRVVMARLKKSGQLNDQHYAHQFTRNRTQSRKQGQFRIARELRARGVTDADINAALETSAAETDPAALVRQRIERKLKSFTGELDERRIASIYSSLLRAGFPADLIRRELKRLTREDVPESDPLEE